MIATLASALLLALFASADVMRPLPAGALRLRGTVDAAIGKSVENWTLGDVPYREFADFFRKGRPQFALGEMWGKFVRAAAFQYRYTGDGRLRRLLEEAVADVLTTERANGSISCNPPEDQPGGKDGDLWERKYVLLALERYIENVKDDPAVRASLVRQADCILAEIGEPPKADIRSLGWSANHIESSTLLEPFVNLYRLTGERRFLDFATSIVKGGGAQGYDLVRQACENVPPHGMGGPYPKAYEMLSFFEGLLEYHRVTGDETAKRACLNLFTNVLTNEITIIGNGGGDRPYHPKVQGEAWDHTAFEQTNPQMKRMMETCVGVTWLKFCGRLLALTGDVRAADAMEKYVYNGLLGAMTPRGDGFSYVNLLNGVKTTNRGWGWNFPSGPVTCCNLNGPIGLAMVPYYAVLQEANGAAVNFYEAFDATVRIGGTEVRLSAPNGLFDGALWRLKVDPARETGFALRFRIPGWSAATSVRVNGTELKDVRPGTYLAVDRTWRGGDCVEIRFDLRARLVPAPHGSNPAGDNFAAVIWGPVVLARDENTDPRFAEAVRIAADTDGFVDVRRVTPSIPGHRFEFEVPTADGTIRMCDYASVDSWNGKRVMTWLPLPGVKVSSFGYDPEDSTRFLQAALDSGAKKIVVDRQKGPWVSLPLQGRSNQEIVFEPGAEIVAKKDAFREKRDCLLRLDGVTNVTIRGGAGSALRMRRDDYAKPPYARSEWRHALAIRNAKNVKVVGMTFAESGGDGVVVSGTSEGIELLDCVMTRNFRQGLSVISCHDLWVENCLFEKTKGTNPESGVDLEPDSPQDRLTSCMFRNCRSVGNAGNAFCIAPVMLNAASAPIGIRFENCVSENDGTGVQVALFRRDGSAYPTGRVVFAGCEFRSPKRGCLLVNKPAGTMDLTFANCRFLDAQKEDFHLETEQWDFDPPDGIRFSNVFVRQPAERPLFTFPVPGYGRKVDSLTGRIEVASPAGRKTVELTPDWCAANIPRAGGADPLPRVAADVSRLWPLGREPDEPHPLESVAVAHWQRYVLRVDSPRTVRLVVRQIPGKSGIRSPIPLKISRIGGTFRTEIPMPKDGPEQVAFEAKEAGHYAMELDGYHSRFVIDEANVPVAIDATRRYREFCLAPGKTSFGFSFRAERGRPFSLLSRVIYAGDDYVCELYDAENRKIAEEKLPAKWNCIRGEADGLVRAVFTRRGEGASRGGNVFIDLTGVPGLLYLSAIRTWHDGLLPVSLATEPDPEVRVVYRNGSPFIAVNGRDYPPYLNLAGVKSRFARSAVQKTAALGFPFFELQFEDYEIERAPGVYDFAPVDHAARTLLHLVPGAYVFLRFRTNFPKWCAVHREAWIGYGKGPVDPKIDEEHEGRAVRPSAASSAYRAELTNFHDRLGEFVRSRPWSKRVVAFRSCWGVFSEWHTYGFHQFPDTGEAMTAAFRRFKGGKYAQDDPPVPAEGERPEFLLDPVRDAKTLDFFQCLRDETMALQLQMARDLKRNFPGRLVGGYSGYVFTSFPPSGQNCWYEALMNAPEIDFCSNPSSYSKDARLPGGSFMQRALPDAFRRHGKLLFLEDDMRFHHVKEWNLKQAHTETPAESAAVMRRDFLLTLFDGCGIQLCDPFKGVGRRPNAFDDPSVLGAMRETIAALAKGERDGAASHNEVLVLVDPRLRYRWSADGARHSSAFRLLSTELPQRLHTCGVPADLADVRDYLAGDYPHRIVCVADAFTLSASESAELVRRLNRPERTAFRLKVAGLPEFLPELEAVAAPACAADWQEVLVRKGARAWAKPGSFLRRRGNLVGVSFADAGSHRLLLPPDSRGATELYSGKCYAGSVLELETDGPETLLLELDGVR